MTAASDIHRITVARATEPGVARHRIRTWSWGTSTYQPGAWIVHCQLCKDRTQFEDQVAALEHARSGHIEWPAHQRWSGVLALGGELPFERGYDSKSSHQNPHNFGDCRIGAELWREARGELRDELAVRRVVRPPTIHWSLSQALGPANIAWPDGRRSRGTFYNLLANDQYVTRIVCLAEGGFIFNDRYIATDVELIRAAA